MHAVNYNMIMYDIKFTHRIYSLLLFIARNDHFHLNLDNHTIPLRSVFINNKNKTEREEREDIT